MANARQSVKLAASVIHERRVDWNEDDAARTWWSRTRIAAREIWRNGFHSTSALPATSDFVCCFELSDSLHERCFEIDNDDDDISQSTDQPVHWLPGRNYSGMF